jgi:hypothetical protein
VLNDFEWCSIAWCLVQSLPVVEQLDVTKDRSASRRARLEAAVMRQFQP